MIGSTNNDQKYIEQYNTLTSFLEYKDYLEDIDSNNLNYGDIEFDRVYAVFISLFFTMVVDQYIYTTEQNGIKNTKLLLYKNFNDDLASIISMKNEEERYEFEGGLSYKDSSVTIAKVRNKLAHGNYVVKNGCICIEEKGIESSIKIDDLIQFIKKFSAEAEKSELTYTNNRVITANANKEPLNGNIDEYLDNINVFYISDKPRMIIRDDEYIELSEKVYELINKIINDNPTITPDEIIKKVKKVYNLKTIGMDIEISSKKLNEKSYYNEITKYYDTNKELLEYNGFNFVDKSIQNIVESFEGKSQYSARYGKGIILNIEMLKLKEKYPEYTIREILNSKMKNPDEFDEGLKISTLMSTNFDDAILTSCLAGFNALYQYGLENTYTVSGQYSTLKLQKKECFNFAHLDIDNLYSSNSIQEAKIEPYMLDLERITSSAYDKKQLEKYGDALKMKDEYLEQTPEDQKHPKQLEYLDLKIEQAKNEFHKALRDSVDAETYFEYMDKDKFIKNLDTLIHIRNSIAHGLVFINSFDDKPFSEKKITFFDQVEQPGASRTCYHHTLTVAEFSQLFSNTNITALKNFLLGNIYDTSQLNQSYQDSLKRYF